MMHLSSKDQTKPSENSGKPIGLDDYIRDLDRWNDDGGRNSRTRLCVWRGSIDLWYYYL